jgi:paraquat-inducible protein B
MTDRPSSGQDDIPEAVAVPKRRWNLSLVWIIPIVAALLGGWVALHYILSKGPTITIEFRNAEGLEAGKTKVRYKSVDIGTVSEIRIAEDRSHVIVTAEIAKQAENLIVDDTRFWIARPRVTLGSITDLGTIFSGAYIGVDAGRSQKEIKRFTGLDAPPPVLSDSPGRQFFLHADNIDSLFIGAPIYFRRVQVGSVTRYTLDADGKGATLTIFINAPNDRFVTQNSRFWHESGVDLSVSSNGVKLNTESLISVLIGGISFQPQPDSPSGAPAEPNAAFTLYPDKATALRPVSRQAQTYLLYFKESLRGLSPGASVDFRGIQIGEVKSIDVEYDRKTQTVRFPVEISVFPERLRPRGPSAKPSPSPLEQDPHGFLEQLVKRGFRAQLKSANLLTGQLFVSLDLFPEAGRTKIDWQSVPPVLPTAPGSMSDIQETLAGLARKLEKIPFNKIGNDMDKTIKALDATLQSADKVLKRLDSSVLPEAGAMLEQTRKTLGDVQQSLSTNAPLQLDVHDTLTEVTRAAQSLRTLADYLGRHPESLIRGKTRDDE